MAVGLPCAAQTSTDSTHDWTSTPGSPVDLREVWADVKSPGTGLTYAVGTIDVVDTRPGIAMFSNAPVQNPPAPALAFVYPPRRQIVILQATNQVSGINFQSYFYGFTPNTEGEGRANNVRGISVFPSEIQLDTRIAICGETYDAILPLSQAPAGNPTATATNPAGFIAVFDGFGVLLWTHHFFGANPAHCAITDVSIRVEDRAGVMTEVVTYCGISTHGAPPAGNASLTPFQWFAAPAAIPGCYTPAAGNSDNFPGQWDGMVGRLARPQIAGPTTTDFHAVVGGREQDGLFGIAEMEDDRFVVVGATAFPSSGIGPLAFPFTNPPGCLDTFAQYCLGVTMIFDASATPGGALVLDASSPIGNVGGGTVDVHTFARDVVVQPNAIPPAGGAPSFDSIYVVGSTDDPAMFASVGVVPSFQPALAGPRDGFILAATDTVGAPIVLFGAGSYYGTEGDDGLTGVQSWNEFADHVAAVGFTRAVGGPNDISVVSIFSDTPTTPGVLGNLLQPMTGARAVLGAPLTNEVPTAMGTIEATAPGVGFFYNDFLLGPPAGGGVAVDQRARVNTVGRTDAFGYPVFGPGRAYLGGTDAVRTRSDMMPLGIGRTDGSGSITLAFPPVPAPLPPFGFTGSTTPAPCLSVFGQLVGGPAPNLLRMLIDYEGLPPAAGVVPALLVDRPPPTAAGLVVGALLQVGWPNPGYPGAPLPPTMINGMEIWLPTAPVTVLAFPAVPSSIRFPLFALPALPPGTAIFSLQSVSLLTAPLCSGFASAASPALWFQY